MFELSSRFFKNSVLITSLVAIGLLSGCKSDVYQGLTEDQVNSMMTVLLKNGIHPEKKATKNGYTLAIENDQIIQTLELMKENSLPRSSYESMGQIFAAKGMISSATEEQARLAYALSQELTDTFSRIDGVLTARVHVVLGAHDLASGKATPPSAAVFLRHTADSQATLLVSQIRELSSNAIPGLKRENVSVMLVPVRETITVPLLEPAQDTGSKKSQLALLAAAILFVLSFAGLGAALYLHYKHKKVTTAESSETP